MKALSSITTKYRKTVRFFSMYNLALVLIVSSACSSVPDQPRWMGDVRRQESSHQFHGATVPQLIAAFEQAFLCNEFGIKEISTMSSSVTATKNTRDGYITITVYFYPTEYYVGAKMVTTANTGSKLGSATNNTILSHVMHAQTVQ